MTIERKQDYLDANTKYRESKSTASEPIEILSLTDRLNRLEKFKFNVNASVERIQLQIDELKMEMYKVWNFVDIMRGKNYGN